MNDSFHLADVLGRYVDRAGYNPGQLARLAGLPKMTVVHWLEGRVKKPRDWRDLVKVAAVLHLNEADATALLQSAGYPSVIELLAQAPNRLEENLLAPWAEALRRQSDRAPFQAIPDLPYFAGREPLLQALTQVLLDGHHVSIYSLQGMGGVGKTALAARAAYRLRPYFPDGVLWAQVDTSDSMSILSTFANAYGCEVNQYADLDGRSRVVRDVLAHKRALIVLDNARSDADVLPLLPPSGSCTVIVTTRRHDLLVTSGAYRLEVGSFDRDGREALDLFKRVLGEARAQSEARALAELADVLGHLPLALVIAASRLAYEPGWSAANFLEYMCQEDGRLKGLAYGDRSVSLSFNFSYDTLPPHQQQFFAALGAFGADEFGVEAAARVAATSNQTAQANLRKLYVLSLVQRERGECYHLHPLLRDYAREKFNRSRFVPRAGR